MRMLAVHHIVEQPVHGVVKTCAERNITRVKGMTIKQLELCRKK